MSFCPNCQAEIAEGEKFCARCGSSLEGASMRSDITIVTTPRVPGFRVRRIVGVVTGLTARTRGVGGQFVAGLQSLVGGEVSAFTSEIEKARGEAIQRIVVKARSLGANAIIGLDMETSGILQGTVLISATGTAVVIEPE
ncbi:MAG: heavy metal-binding domain-containing protein [Candidatus Bathyarchaeota archaeon]|nr:heavy metal-binding domain-containing protein [Candidatus Bathyarchaeota archaeon]